MNLSGPGRRFIQSKEALRLVPYQDGGGEWTWGYGHKKGPHEPIPDRITIDQANDLFDQDSAWACQDVGELFDNDVAQNVFDALVSFLFNIGLTQLRALPHRTLDAILAQAWPTVAELMLNWCHDNGKFVQGLYDRRKQEGAILLTGVYP
jgi:lysozyme